MAAGKGIAKAKCPSCSNKFGDKKAYKISKSPSDKVEKEQEEDVSDVLKPRTDAIEKSQPGSSPSRSTEGGSRLSASDLAGKWKMMSLGRDGKFDQPDDVSSAGIVFTIDGDNYSVMAGDKIQEQGTLILHADKDPAELDQAITEGPDAGKSHLGIIRLVEGSLHNCQASFGEPRPKSFDAQPGSTATLAIFDRG